MLGKDLVCDTCGRDFSGYDDADFEGCEDIRPGAACPSKDCPSTCDKCGEAGGVSDFDNNGIWAEVEALCPACRMAAEVAIETGLDDVTAGLLGCLRDACAT